MLAVLFSGLVTGYAIAIPVGAVAILLVSLTAQHGWRTGAGAALGVACVDGAYAAVAVVAGHAVSVALEPLRTPLRVVSVVALLGIAVLTLRAGLGPVDRTPRRDQIRWTPIRAWSAFAGITAVNPATVVYFSAVVLAGTVPIDGPAQGGIFVAAAFAASASWQLGLVGLGHSLGRWISTPLGRRATAVVAAVAITGLALKPVLSG